MTIIGIEQATDRNYPETWVVRLASGRAADAEMPRRHAEREITAREHEAVAWP